MGLPGAETASIGLTEQGIKFNLSWYLNLDGAIGARLDERKWSISNAD